MHYPWSELLCSVRMRIVSFTIDALRYNTIALSYGLYNGSKSLSSEASAIVMHHLRSDPIDGIFCIIFRYFTNRKTGKVMARALNNSFSALFAQVLNKAAIAHKLLCLHPLSGRTKGVFSLPFLIYASIMCLSAILWNVESPNKDFLAGGSVRTPYDNQC